MGTIGYDTGGEIKEKLVKGEGGGCGVLWTFSNTVFLLRRFSDVSL